MTTCPRKGCLLSFELNSTLTLDDSVQSLETMSGMILNQSQPKFAAKNYWQIGCKCGDLHLLDELQYFDLKIF